MENAKNVGTPGRRLFFRNKKDGDGQQQHDSVAMLNGESVDLGTDNKAQLTSLLNALKAAREGDFSVRLPVQKDGVMGEIAGVFNDVIGLNEGMANEIIRVSKVVGEEGQMTERVSLGVVTGMWASQIDSVNALINNLSQPTVEVGRVITAVAEGDLTQKMRLEVEGVPVKGEFLRIATISNTMVDQLSAFGSEVTRVAREIGVEGKLGAQAEVPGVAGTWRELTDKVNMLASNLTSQVRNIAEVTTAVAQGDLTRKITVEAMGEVLELKNTNHEEATSMAHSQSPESKSESAYIKVEKLLKLMVDKHASDLHLRVSSPPVLRIDGVLVPQDDLPPLTASDIESAFKQVVTEDQRIAFARERYLDLAYSVHGLARFRLNILQQRGTLSFAFRFIPFKIPSIDELELPQICKELVMKPRGLILVTGTAGSGKSTTLAAMISHLNENERRNVIIIEDPIEFLYPDKKCLIAQLELGDDTKSFAAALKHALRHDPNAIVIGEMRDLDTISTAITAAETGHLILGTLHTIDAVQSVDRLVDMFPDGQQRQVRLQLSQVIEAVLSQRLVTRSGGGQIAAFEIMIANSVIRRLIREDQAFEIPANIEMSVREGMQTLDQALAGLVRRNIVTTEEAMMKSSDPGRLSKLLQH